jgi:hypothetical protein
MKFFDLCLNRYPFLTICLTGISYLAVFIAAVELSKIDHLITIWPSHGVFGFLCIWMTLSFIKIATKILSRR